MQRCNANVYISKYLKSSEDDVHVVGEISRNLSPLSHSRRLWLVAVLEMLSKH
jgi:hypothetical protein